MLTAANVVQYAVGVKDEVTGAGVFSNFKLEKDSPKVGDLAVEDIDEVTSKNYLSVFGR